MQGKREEAGAELLASISTASSSFQESISDQTSSLTNRSQCSSGTSYHRVTATGVVRPLTSLLGVLGYVALRLTLFTQLFQYSIEDKTEHMVQSEASPNTGITTLEDISLNHDLMKIIEEFPPFKLRVMKEFPTEMGTRLASVCVYP